MQTNCPTYETARFASPLLTFQPMDCDRFFDACGELINCPPMDAMIDPENGGFVKSNWIKHVIFFIINSDEQDNDCNLGYGLRRGAPSDGFVNVKHGNAIWKPQKSMTSRDNVKEYVNMLKNDLSIKFKALGIDLKPNVTYKVTGAYSYFIEVNVSNETFKYNRDTRKQYFDWAA